jgi:hypothetical protein
MAFENRFSTSEKLFKACSSLSRDRRGWVYLSVGVLREMVDIQHWDYPSRSQRTKLEHR